MKRIFRVLILGLFLLSAGKSSFAMMGTCGMGNGSGKGHSGHAEAAETKSSAQTAAEEVGNKVCPVSSETISEAAKATYEYKGKVYNFCCPACIDEFKKNPQEYIEKINEQKNTTEEAGQQHGHQH